MEEKVAYLKNFPKRLSILAAHTRGKWGKMNAQQMVEHLTESVRIANGKLHQQPCLNEEQTEKARKLFLSDKPFRENTVNPLLPTDPPPCRNVSMEEAIKELEQELEEFFLLFQDPLRITINPFAGPFNYTDWIHLFHKHFQHHARQFALEE